MANEQTRVHELSSEVNRLSARAKELLTAIKSFPRKERNRRIAKAYLKLADVSLDLGGTAQAKALLTAVDDRFPREEQERPIAKACRELVEVIAQLGGAAQDLVNDVDDALNRK